MALCAELAGSRVLRSIAGFRGHTRHALVVRSTRGVEAGSVRWRHRDRRLRSDLRGDECRLWLACLRNRRDNPVSRVSATLSVECQEPCQPSLRGVARKPVILALQRFAGRRRSVGRNLVRGLLDPPTRVTSTRCHVNGHWFLPVGGCWCSPRRNGLTLSPECQ